MTKDNNYSVGPVWDENDDYCPQTIKSDLKGGFDNVFNI